MLRLHSDSAGHALYQSIRWAACNQDLVLHLGSQIAARLAATGGGLPFASKFIRTQYRRRSDKLVAGKVKHKDGKLERASSPRPPVVGAGLTFSKVGFLNFAVRAFGQCAEKSNTVGNNTWRRRGTLALSTLGLVSYHTVYRPTK